MSNVQARIPTIIIDVQGGVIQSMVSSSPVRVIVLDGDVEGNLEDKIVEIDGSDVIVSDHKSVEIDPDFVVSVVDQLVQVTQ